MKIWCCGPPGGGAIAEGAADLEGGSWGGGSMRFWHFVEGSGVSSLSLRSYPSARFKTHWEGFTARGFGVQHPRAARWGGGTFLCLVELQFSVRCYENNCHVLCYRYNAITAPLLQYCANQVGASPWPNSRTFCVSLKVFFGRFIGDFPWTMALRTWPFWEAQRVNDQICRGGGGGGES